MFSTSTRKLVAAAQPQAAAHVEGDVAGDGREQRLRRGGAQHAREHLGQRLTGGEQHVVGGAGGSVGAVPDQAAGARAAIEEVGDAAARARGPRAPVFQIERREPVLAHRAVDVRLDPEAAAGGCPADPQPSFRCGRAALDVGRAVRVAVLGVQVREDGGQRPGGSRADFQRVLDAPDARVVEIGVHENGAGGERHEHGAGRRLRADHLVAQRDADGPGGQNEGDLLDVPGDVVDEAHEVRVEAAVVEADGGFVAEAPLGVEAVGGAAGGHGGGTGRVAHGSAEATQRGAAPPRTRTP